MANDQLANGSPSDRRHPAPVRRVRPGECGGIVGTPPSLCTLPEGHGSRCEWFLTYEARLPDGTGLVVTFDNLGGALLAVQFPDGSRTYGEMPRVDNREKVPHA